MNLISHKYAGNHNNMYMCICIHFFVYWRNLINFEQIELFELQFKEIRRPQII